MITEARIKQLKEELPPAIQKLVGKSLFAGTHRDAMITKQKEEPNTEWEAEAYNNLRDWIERSTEDIAKFYLKYKDAFDALKSEFPKIMQPPIGKPVYRGTQIKIDSLVATIKTAKIVSYITLEGDKYLNFQQVPYAPYNPAQSWTLKKGRAVRFGDSSSTNLHVIYKTTINNDFIFNPDYLNALNNIIMKEYETIRVAASGRFNAYIAFRQVQSSMLLHKISSAKPYFDGVLKNWNKIVRQVQSGELSPGSLTSGFHTPLEVKDYVPIESWDLYTSGYDSYALHTLAQSNLTQKQIIYQLYKAAAKKFEKSLK